MKYRKAYGEIFDALYNTAIDETTVNSCTERLTRKNNKLNVVILLNRVFLLIIFL